MTEETLMKGIFTAIYSAILAWMFFGRDSDSDLDSDRQRRLPLIPSGMLLPLCIWALLCLLFVFFDVERTMELVLDFCFSVFLHTCLYYLLLMAALPLLRRHISALTCAVLWMLPNLLYITQVSYMELAEPRWVIEAPFTLVQVLFAVWLIGFAAVQTWKILSHLVFRRRILRDAAPVTDPAVLAVWQQEVESARFHKPKFKLVTSPNIQTPLTVGLVRRSVRVVLPERDYTPEELALVFRHELVHIAREDSGYKFMLVFNFAMCWFNPLMWVAMKKSSEDLELSCDEMVLQDSDEDTKRRYAGLLLKTAGDERGFTTCLSASASALRYRLKSVVSPKKKHSGGLVVGLVFFLLCMSCGHVALAYGESTGADAIYKSRPPETYTLRTIYGENINAGKYDCTDEAALGRYLSGLRMEHISGNYSFDGEGTSRTMLFETPEGTLGVILSDRFVRMTLLAEHSVTECFYLPDGTDWGTLEGFIVERPELKVRITGPEDEYGDRFSASLSYAGSADGGETLYEMDPNETPGGLWGHAINRYTQAAISFNLPLDGDCEVEIAPLNGGSSRTVRLDGELMTFSLSGESARYTVRGMFLGKDGKRYRLEFQFEIGEL